MKQTKKQTGTILNIINYLNGLKNYQYKKYRFVNYRMHIFNEALNILILIILFFLVYLTIPLSTFKNNKEPIYSIMSIAIFIQFILNYIFYIMYHQTFVQRLLNIRLINIKTLKSLRIHYCFLRYSVWFFLYIVFIPVVLLLINQLIPFLYPITMINKYLASHIFHFNLGTNAQVASHKIGVDMKFLLHYFITTIFSINIWYISFFIDWIIYKRMKNNRTLIDKLFKSIMIHNQ